MNLEIAVVVDIGTTYEKNDDRVLTGTVIYDQSKGAQTLQLPVMAAVCDGVGGYAGGGYAAELVLSELAGHSTGELADADKLACVLDGINRKILCQQKNLPAYENMCTTIAGVVFLVDKTILFHAGDSRVYRYDGSYLRKMTYDHSVVQELMDQGVLTEEEAARFDGRNLIRRCLGSEVSLPPEIGVIDQPVQKGEVYLLCSDGLWDVMTGEDIAEVLDRNITGFEKAETLVQMAKDRGSVDNISVCICEAPCKTTEDKSYSEFTLD